VSEQSIAGLGDPVIRQQYDLWRVDPTHVGADWRAYFDATVTTGPSADEVALAMIAGFTPAPAATNGHAAPTPAPAAAPTPVEPPAGGQALKGPALRLAQNMETSLDVPTATTFRTLAVRTMEQRRTQLNATLAAAGSTHKLSFTHLIAFALTTAYRQYRVMGHQLLVRGGTRFRVEPPHLGLGIAVDMTRKDGSRGLVVPVIKQADTFDFAGFHTVYEGLVEKARKGALMPDDFAGATMTLTNPGGLGTVASVPRLMHEQGTIVAVGAIAYPAEWASVPAATLQELNLSKVMTVTSTYDHRIIQGAESGGYLALVDRLLQGEESFYEQIAGTLGIMLGALPAAAPVSAKAAAPLASAATLADLNDVAAAMALVKAFRTHGHLAATLDPLGVAQIGDPALDPKPLGLSPEVMKRIPATVLRIAVPGETLHEALPHLQSTYCGTLAYEVEHISDHEQRVWLRAQIESGAHRPKADPDEQRALFARLVEVQTLENFLHKAYLGQKRFSIEGVDMLVPMLDDVIELSGRAGARQVVLGMAHRGRLNVLAHTVNKPYEQIFAEFEGGRHVEGKLASPDGGTGDVKYHHGAVGMRTTKDGRPVTVALMSNPSHLEFVGAVVDGRARALQTNRKGREAVHDPSAVLPVIIHGDAAFAGQGVVAETLNLGALKGYGTGGTVHIIVNNQVGFTTDVEDSRSTRHASDLAKGFDVPIIHVNADDPDACRAAVRLAMAFREKFGRDVLIDLVGYRRHGHNEGDEPSYTQPTMYARIKDLPTVKDRYAERLAASGVLSRELAEQQSTAAYQRLVDVQTVLKGSLGSGPAAAPARTEQRPGAEVDTTVAPELLNTINERLLTWPETFNVNPKLKKQLERRRTAFGPDGGIDWGHAESLAIGSLLMEGIPVRFTGQDTERGTFSQRQMVLHDMHNGAPYTPIMHLPGAQAPLELHNSPLSELATLGFEYGYAGAADEALVLWEAQFGDFINGAQVIIDQFLASGLSKWGVTTRLTLLLPHGYEGQGPEHSSGRMERFLQLSAEDNMRVANCTTPAQYFHLLRRQARRTRQRPLIIFTPKSLLRNPLSANHQRDLTHGSFHPVLDDATTLDPASVARVVLCSGKVYYDLLAEREKQGRADGALVRLEQLYSFPTDELQAVLSRYPSATEIVWAQEEPRNMGAWFFVEPHLRGLLDGRTLRYSGRPERASTAEGYPAAHQAAQLALVQGALGG